VRDLAPLQNMPLTSLSLYFCVEVRDLTPLNGLKLSVLNVAGTPLSDLSVLGNMPLQELVLTPKNINRQSMDMLRQMKTVKTIGVVDRTGARLDKWPAAEFWKRYNAGEFK
jgi:hypothetical protein